MSTDMTNSSLANEVRPAAAPKASSGNADAPKTGFALWLQRLKDAKEVALIMVFFGSGIVWVVNYFATRHELEHTRHELEQYKCVNNLSVQMLLSTQNASFLDYQIRVARRDLRATEDLLARQDPYSETRKNLTNQLDEQKANLDKLQKSQDDSEKKGTDAFSKLQTVQQGKSACK
jgi:hypothetical protein